MVEEEEKNHSSIMYIIPELLEEIFILLPLKSILKCRTVSKQWKSILESRSFTDKFTTTSLRFNKRRILAAYNCDCGGQPRLLPESRLVRKVEIFTLHCDTSQPSMTCDGLICFPEEDWFIVFNPSTRQLRRFPSGLNPNHICRFGFGLWSRFLPRNWVMGFGRDEVTGSYKVVRMCFSYKELGQKDPMVECGVLDVETGQWGKLNPPPYVVHTGSKSACVNGSIYWLHIDKAHVVDEGYKILALDLHTKEFHNVSVPSKWVTRETQIANLENRLAVARTRIEPIWKLDIWSMDTKEDIWRRTYSISLDNIFVSWTRHGRWFTPVLVSKQRILVFHDNRNRLFKYYPWIDHTRCVSGHTCVISPYVENISPLPLKPSHPNPDNKLNSDGKTRIPRCRLLSRQSKFWMLQDLQENKFKVLDILFTSIVVAGYFLLPR
ncbi:unnamed protein product [Cochlearia groenlandica]